MTSDASQPWTVLRLINWTRAYFDRAEVESPRLSAEILLAHVLGCSRIDLYTRFGEAPSDEQRTAFRELVRRAAEHYPVAYLVGVKEFYSLPIKVTPDVLIPRSETEILVGEAIAHLSAQAGAKALWDACTVSGCIAAAVARQISDVTVLATDISSEAVAVAAENAAAHGLAERVCCCVADLLALPEDWDGPKQFDAITANPPYVAEPDDVAENVRHEPSVALYAGQDGLALLRPLVAAAPGFLRPGGALIFEFAWNQADAVRDLIVENPDLTEPRVLLDHQQIERAAVSIRR